MPRVQWGILSMGGILTTTPVNNVHYAKLSRALRAPWVDRFLNNEIYCYPLSKKRCGPPIAIPSDRLEGIVTWGRQQRNVVGATLGQPTLPSWVKCSPRSPPGGRRPTLCCGQGITHHPSLAPVQWTTRPSAFSPHPCNHCDRSDTGIHTVGP